MRSINKTKARATPGRPLAEMAESSEPVTIVGSRGSAVLVAEDDWRAIGETLRLLSIPGLRESIRAGMTEPLADSSDEPGW